MWFNGIMAAILRSPLHGLRSPLPVVSSGQWGGQASETWRRTRTVDLLTTDTLGLIAPSLANLLSKTGAVAVGWRGPELAFRCRAG